LRPGLAPGEDDGNGICRLHGAMVTSFTNSNACNPAKITKLYKLSTGS
jgi:hypothetical protein